MVTEELIYKEYYELCTKYKKLLPPQSYGSGWKIDGEFDVIDSDGNRWETYGISIIVPHEFPYDLPILIETSNKIERTVEWHNSNGVCCLATNAIIYNSLGSHISLMKWMDRFVHDFLANHVVRLLEKNYVRGEYPHYEEGMLVGYKEIFGLEHNTEVMYRLNLLCGVVTLGRNEICFCGSGKKYKRCFLIKPQEHYYNIPISVLNKERIQIANWIKK